jgi:cob(I)alamin adenosyltransferase
MTAEVKIYTRTGDDGTTGLLYGGRVAKDAAIMQINGAVDEAQAVMGLARAEAVVDSELDRLLTALERDLYVLMAEVATDPSRRDRLQPGRTLVTVEMVAALEDHIDDLKERFEMPTDFVVPGANRAAAALDVARTVVRRAERLLWSAPVADSQVGPYLNRLSDLLWAMARWVEGEHHLLARTRRRGGGAPGPDGEPAGGGPGSIDPGAVAPPAEEDTRGVPS